VQSTVEFNRKRSSRDGLQNVCRECNRARARRYYRENREKHIRVNVERVTKARLIALEVAGAHLVTNRCMDCGEGDIRVLDFDHRPGTGKTQNVMYLVHNGYSIERVQAEIAKCDVRCRNCHARVTYERLGNDWRTDFRKRSSGAGRDETTG
jgi:hypothetical protein